MRAGHGRGLSTYSGSETGSAAAAAARDSLGIVMFAPDDDDNSDQDIFGSRSCRLELMEINNPKNIDFLSSHILLQRPRLLNDVFK